MDYIFSLVFFVFGLIILSSKQLEIRGVTLDLSSNYLYIIAGSSLMIYSFLAIYASIKYSKNHKKPLEHTICPTCKQTYNYKDLENGKCPTCEDVDTIDIEQYYKENPFKEDEEKKED